MKQPLLLIVAAMMAALPVPAQDLRWVGLDMNTLAAAPSFATDQSNTRHHVTPTFMGLTSLPWGPGPNLGALTGFATAATGGSAATTGWQINPFADTLTLTLNHSITGPIAPNNYAGSEGVFYFFALTPGTVTVTYDYGLEETDDPTLPYKVSERGQSRSRVKNNALGLGDYAGGTREYVNRDGSRTFTADVGPESGLIALQFDFRILDDPMPTAITGGYLTLSFTPIPEPSAAALLGLGLVGLLGWRRRGAQARSAGCRS